MSVLGAAVIVVTPVVLVIEEGEVVFRDWSLEGMVMDVCLILKLM